MQTAAVLDMLMKFESRNVTFIDSKDSWPIVWQRAKGSYVWDADGNKYLDLTAAFGVAAAGHANTQVIRAGQRQMAELLHAMSDVHPHALKAQLARTLSALTFERWSDGSLSGKTIFCNSGFEAVEAALKTAALATGKSDIIAFKGAYHGLGYGALNVTERAHFRSPFRRQIREFGHFVNFPKSEADLQAMEIAIRALLQARPIGAILAEPVQGRAGVNIPPRQFLPLLREICSEFGILFILDEIFTGFGRTGTWFASEHHGVIPDVVCLGKALTGGFPLSACIGKGDLMDDAWPAATGDPLHTSTFLGHPVGCAMALAQIAEITRLGLVERSAQLGSYLRHALACLPQSPSLILSYRSIGLLAGLELRLPDGSPATDVSLALMKAMLRRGFVLLCDGEYANTVTLSPPLTITKSQIMTLANSLSAALLELNESSCEA